MMEMNERLTPMLTMAAMQESKDWEAALSLPFPTDATSELLSKARKEVIEYLDYVTGCVLFYQQPSISVSKEVQAEIRRACDRLMAIAEALPVVVDAEVAAALKRASDYESPMQPPSR